MAKLNLLTWREVMDCKIPGTNIVEMKKIAKDNGYDYICHNENIFSSIDPECKPLCTVQEMCSYKKKAV